jgi:quinol monooxygenase YgiN
MYTIYVVFNCHSGKREDFIKRVYGEGIVDAIRAEDGCLMYDFYYSEKDENELLLVEAWASRRHQEIHMTQEHMARFRILKGNYIESSHLGEFDLK